MVNKRKLGKQVHGIMTKYVPALWTFGVFVGITSYTSFLRIVDPLVYFTSVGFVIGGGAFLYEALTVWPDKGKFAGLATAILMLMLGVINFILGIAVFQGWFNPYFNTSILVLFSSVMLGLSTILLVIIGTVEIALGRRVIHLLGGKKTSP